MDQAFRDAISAGYAFDEPTLIIGSAMHDGRAVQRRPGRRSRCRRSTGTASSRAPPAPARRRPSSSSPGSSRRPACPVFVADIKGDLTGLAAPGDAREPEGPGAGGVDRLDVRRRPVIRSSSCRSPGTSAHRSERPSTPSGRCCSARCSTSTRRRRASSPSSSSTATTTTCRLLDLKDLATTLKFLSSDEGKPILEDYGGMSPASVGVLLRSIVVLEQEGADVFFGEPEFDVEDLLRTTPDGQGIISVLELSDVMDQPRLFSTFMLWMLAQLYETLPEAGDLPKPKLCFFFDEAHLLFDDASEALMDQIERTARLIRSKGVGVYFVTQVPSDVPASVLAQLGNRVQHALRAFTPDDADALRKAARTFPTTEFYDVEKTLTSLGTGEALVTVLSPRGYPDAARRDPAAAARLADGTRRPGDVPGARRRQSVQRQVRDDDRSG